MLGHLGCQVLPNPVLAAADKDRDFLLVWVQGVPEKLEVSWYEVLL